jgi:hypothetical protein
MLVGSRDSSFISTSQFDHNTHFVQMEHVETDPLVSQRVSPFKTFALLLFIGGIVALAALGLSIYSFVQPGRPTLCDTQPLTCHDQAEFDADTERSRFSTVLCIVAHPDDIECAGFCRFQCRN